MTSSTVKFQEDPRDTRMMIVSAARRVLASEGAAQMTLAAVAQEAEMTVEELTTHYQDVHEMITAIAADDLAAVGRGSSEENYSSPLAALEQRAQALETAFAEMVERHEKALRERSGMLSWVEQSVNTLRERIEASERHHADAISELRSALAASATLIMPSTQHTSSAPAQPMPEFPPMTFGEDTPELPPLMTEGVPNSAAPSGSSEKTAGGMDSYLSSARRAAMDAQQGGEHEKKAKSADKRTSRTRFFIAACVVPLGLFALFATVLNRHVVTAMPVLTPPAPTVNEVAKAPVPLSAPPQVTVMPPTDPTPSQLAGTAPVEKLTEMAAAGDLTSERDLGLKYLAGDGVSVNESEAARWLMRAAYKGEPTAEYWLGTLYARGHGVPADAFQANHWYEAAAKQGNRRAMHSYAVAYFQGWGVEKNFVEAARWFTSAAELGNTDSQFNLAVLYERGAGVQQSLTEAYKWYAIAAKAGDKEADSRVAALATQIPPGDLALAQQAASNFKPSQMNERANAAGGPESSGG